MFRYCIFGGFIFTQSVVNSTHLSGVGRAPGSSCLVLCLFFVCYQNQNYAIAMFVEITQVVPGSAATALASCPVPDQLRTNQSRSLVILFLRTTK